MNDPKSILEPLGGYIVDVVAKLRNRQFVPHSLTKLHNMKTCRDMSGATTAVEIGSYKGVMTKRLSYLFENVVSVEIDEALFHHASKRCAGRKNVELLLGDGSKLLPEIACRVNNALIFLDGHFSGGITGQGDEPEPVLKELDIIKESLGRFCAVIVDDFRLFGVEPGWPRKSEVMQRLEDVFPSKEWIHGVLNDQFVATRRRS